MNSPQKQPPTRAEVFGAMKTLVSADKSRQRLAVTATSQRTMWLASSLMLDEVAAQSEWQANDSVWTWRLRDLPTLRAQGWQDGVFLRETRGKSLPVVLGIEDTRGEVKDWLWGMCEDWGFTHDEGDEIEFEIWPMLPLDHPLRKQEVTPHVHEAMLLNMERLASFEGLYVIYLRLTLF